MIARPTTDDRRSTTNASQPAPRNWRTWRSFALRPSFLVIGLFIVALVPRIFWLDAQSLWLDEGSTWQTIQQGWSTLLIELGNPVAAYPLYHVLLKGWVALAGDSEWALRCPSALAGAGAVVAIYFAAGELQQTAECRQQLAEGSTTIRYARPAVFPLTAALLLLAAPFALWYAQEAKAYSLLLLVSTLIIWSLLRALRQGTRRAWLVFGAIALTSVFVHRLAVLLLVAAWAGYLLVGTSNKPGDDARMRRREDANAPFFRRCGAAVLRRWSLLVLISLGIIAAMVLGLGSDRAETGAYIPANPAQALWLTFVRFSVDRWPGDIPWWWLLPWAALALWGSAKLLREVKAGQSKIQNLQSKLVLLCFLVIPLALFLIQLAFTRLYEARYLMLIYPAWVLLLAYPMTGDRRYEEVRMRGSEDARKQQTRLIASSPPRLIASQFACFILLIAAVATSIAVLVQPEHGLFSGDPVKEQYREAIQELAARVHPDDLVVLHPAYLRPLYDYYMQRLTADPPPEPVTFAAFKQGQQEFSARDWDAERKQHFAGHLRSFLLIAPEHARTVDVPRPADDYGLLGLYFQYSREQNKWPCGIWRFVGVHLLCQDSPETYETGEVVRPEMPLPASFGTQIKLLGYTLKATGPEEPGIYQAGGTLPITLFWDVARQPDKDYSMFLHLCRDCGIPPVASTDGQPLEGYLPTSVWLPGKPVHDERAIPLPPDLPPGRYTLLLGVYPPGESLAAARLAVRGERVLDNNRMVLGTVEISAPE